MRRIFWVIFCLVFAAVSSQAAVYYVKLGGNDDLDGLTPATAWASIDNGDAKSLLMPGDTINILPSVYNIVTTIHLKTHGTAIAPIVYKPSGTGTIIVDAGNLPNINIMMEGDHTQISNFELTNSQTHALHLKSDSCVISDVYMHEIDGYGVFLEGSGNLLLRNIIYQAGSDGIHILDAAQNNLIYNNTISSCAGSGIFLNNSATAERIFNNIIIENNYGISGLAGSICAFNDVWNNSSANYINGIADSAESISQNPLLEDPAGGDFSLQNGSPCINAGIDLGYSYIGSAPDMGAVEYLPAGGNVYWVSTTGNDLDDGLDSTTAWATINNGDDKGVLAPGDTVKVMPGLYGPTTEIKFKSSGTADFPIIYMAAEEENPVFDAAGANIIIFLIEGDHVRFNGFELANADDNLIHAKGEYCTVTECYLHDGGKNGIRTDAKYNLTLRNLIVNMTEDGIKNEGSGDFCRHWGNTIYLCGTTGIELKEKTVRCFNNIIVDCNEGIKGSNENICAFNDVWNNLSDNYTGTSDSAGGISEDPLFVDAPAGDFSLQHDSPCIDAGLDLGYPFHGTAPDMGAVETDAKYIRIEWFDGTPFDDTTLTTDDDGLVLYCRGYTSNDSLLGDFPASWAFLEGDSIGTIDTATGTSTTLDLYKPGTGKITATMTPLMADTSGNLDVITGDPKYMSISPDSATISTDSSIVFSAVAFDTDSNSCQPGIVPIWTVLNGIGSMEFDGTFTCHTAGEEYVIGTAGILADTVGPITIVAGALDHIIITPDSSIITADSSMQFTVEGFDSWDNETDPGNIDWSLTVPIGSIDSTGFFDAVTAGITNIIATSDLGPVDTTLYLEVTPGRLTTLTVFPDSVNITSDSTVIFGATGADNDGNSADIGDLTWDVVDGIGLIGGTGLFDPITVGTGRIAVTSSIDGITDTNLTVIVTPGDLDYIEIVPNEIAVGIGDTVQFNVVGYDADSNVTDAGTINWDALGRVGDIDALGQFIAVMPGQGKVAAVSIINNISDTSDFIDVDELYLTSIPFGDRSIQPSEQNVAVLAFNIKNYFDTDKNITAMSLHDASSGNGSTVQLLSNIDSLSLYIDSDNDSALTDADSLIAVSEYSTEILPMAFDPLTIPEGSELSFLLGISAVPYPRDGDSCDLFILPATDITTGDGTIVAGPDSCNSLGHILFDGMISDQLTVLPGGADSISPGNTIYNILTFDIPRNGYEQDTLQIISIVNDGDAADSDLDSLILYKDNGDNIWGGNSTETKIGLLTFVGDRWTISGLSIPLVSPETRFYIGTIPTAYPTHGATLAFGMPKNGLEMASGNDGPIDQKTMPPDTVTIVTAESISIKSVPIPATELIPGTTTDALFTFELTNSYADQAAIDSIGCRLYAIDPDGAAQTQLDSQVDSVALYLNRDGIISFLSEFDSLVAKSPVIDGKILFNLEDFNIDGRGGNVGLTVTAWLNPDNCKNDNLINIGIENDTKIYTAGLRAIDGDFPVKNNFDFIINAFPASGIVNNAIEISTIFGDQADQPAFDFTLPGNGYADDALFSLRLLESGNFSDSRDLLTLKLWADISDNGYSPDDILLGQPTASGSFWQISGLSYPIPSGGQRFIITVDVAGEQFDGGTFRLSIPVEGAVFTSGMTGPDDSQVSNGDGLLIFPSDQIIAIPIPASSSNIYPNSRKNELMTLALYNGYIGRDRTLQSITLKNISQTASSTDFADDEIGQISLYYDNDFSGTFGGDSLLTSGQFAEGILQLTGFDIILPAESLSYFFVIADVPDNMIDADSLAVQVTQSLDLVFTEQVKINGSFPLKNGGYAIVDGSVADQYDILSIPTPTLSPGDTSVTLMAFKPALNGDLVDNLESLTIVNMEDADTSDISSLELWMDRDEDNIWQSTDSIVGTFAFINESWILDLADISLNNSAPTFFITGDIASAAMPGAQFRGGIPIDGCQYTSGNDGPIDTNLIENGVFKISNSGLRITCDQLNETYSIGQAVDIDLTVTNLLPITMDNVMARVTGISDSAIVTFTGGNDGPVSLAAGQSTSFSFSYTAVATGEVFWQLQAEETITGDSSAVIASDQIKIQAAPNDAIVQLINSVPASVIRGQTNVFPLSIKCPHPDSSVSAASLRLGSIRLHVEDGGGTPLAAAQVFSRMVLSNGYTNLSILENLPDQANVDFVFSEPMIVMAGQEQLISLLVDIDENAVSNDFILSVDDASAIPLLDNNTSQPVIIDTSVHFPLRTVSCRIDDPSQQMVVSDSSLLSPAANYGQDNVDVILLRLRHPGAVGSSQIQLTAISCGFVDQFAADINAFELFRYIRLLRQQTVISELNLTETDTSQVELKLASPLTLSPGDQDSIKIEVGINGISAYSGFSVTISDSTAFVVRDLSSGLPLETGSDTAYTLASESVFPINSGWADLNQPSESPQICISTSLPSTIVGGRDSLEMIDFSIAYPVDVEYSSTMLNEIYMTVIDTTGMILDPRELFDKAGFRIDNGPVVYQDFIQPINGSLRFDLNGGILVAPGDSINLQLICDIESSSPYDHFILELQTEEVIVLSDYNDPDHSPGFSADDGCAVTFPFVTEMTSIYKPAGQPVISVDIPPTQISHAGCSEVLIWEADLQYSSDLSQGDLDLTAVNGHIYERTSSGITTITGTEIFSAVSLLIDDETAAIDTLLADNMVTFVLSEPYIISSGADIHIGIRCDIGPDAENGNYFIRFEDPSFIDISDHNLATTIVPVLDGISLPISSAEISLVAGYLSESFTNYPNPFNPTMEPTIIGFVLAEDAYIDVEIFTITGEAVREVTMNSMRIAGPHNEDTWSGDNDRGLDVVPGTYFCRITARYLSGGTDSFRRKIAVIR